MIELRKGLIIWGGFDRHFVLYTKCLAICFSTIKFSLITLIFITNHSWSITNGHLGTHKLWKRFFYHEKRLRIEKKEQYKGTHHQKIKHETFDFRKSINMKKVCPIKIKNYVHLLGMSFKFLENKTMLEYTAKIFLL